MEILPCTILNTLNYVMPYVMTLYTKTIITIYLDKTDLSNAQ